jgi:phosphatidylglycerol:prolipoprotein diacylglycerol transferase
MRIEAAGAHLAVVSDLDPSFLWAAALLGAMVYFTRDARRLALDCRAAYWACVCAIVSGLWGSHLLGLYVHGNDGGAWAALSFFGPGKSLFGGLCAGGIAAALCFHYRRVPVLAYSDAAMPAVALGYAIGRVGCFLNGDDFGVPTTLPWAVTYPAGTEAYADHLSRGWIASGAAASLPVHPVQLYHALVGLALFFLMLQWRPRRAGTRVCGYVALYGVARFFLEFVRGDFRPVAGPFSLPQLFSLFFVCAGMGLWLSKREWSSKRHRAITDPILAHK